MSMPISPQLLEQGVKRIFSPLPKNGFWWGIAALGVSGLAISQCLNPRAKDYLQSLRSWRVYRLLPSPRPLSDRKLAIGGVSLLFAAAIIYATYPYLGVLLNSPFPKVFSLRLYSPVENSVIALMGTVICLGTRYLVSAFKIQISLNPLKLWVSKHKTKVVSPSVASPSEGLGWTACPSEILGKYVFPRVLSQTISFKDFFELTTVCSSWRAALLHPDCLTSAHYDPHFLWVLFKYNHLDVMDVVAFFNQFLPAEHQGDGLVLPLDSLSGCLQNYTTPAQLAHIVRRFPQAEIESLTLCIADDDAMPQTAEFLNHFLTQGKIRKLTLACERLRNPKHKDPIGKILTKAKDNQRYEFNRKWRNSPFHKNFSSQLIELLNLLRGEIPILWFQMLPTHSISKIDYNAIEIKNLDVIKILTILQGAPATTCEDPVSTLPILKVTREIRFQPYAASPRSGQDSWNPNAEMHEVSPFIRVPKERIALPGVVETLIERKPAPQPDESKTLFITLVCPSLLPGHLKVYRTSLVPSVEEVMASKKQ